MAVNEVTIKSLGGRMQVDLPLIFSGMTLTVGAGSFLVDGTSYVLLEDYDYEVVPHETEVMWLDVYLVRVKADGGVGVLVVDTVPAEGADLFRFDDACPWEHLHLQAVLAVPPGAVSLDAVEARRRRVVALSEES